MSLDSRVRNLEQRIGPGDAFDEAAAETLGQTIQARIRGEEYDRVAAIAAALGWQRGDAAAELARREAAEAAVPPHVRARLDEIKDARAKFPDAPQDFQDGKG